MTKQLNFFHSLEATIFLNLTLSRCGLLAKLSTASVAANSEVIKINLITSRLYFFSRMINVYLHVHPKFSKYCFISINAHAKYSFKTSNLIKLIKMSFGNPREIL